MAIRAVVWGENIHDRENAVVQAIYPKGMHGAIAEALNADPGNRGDDRDAGAARARPDRRRGSPRPTC